MRDRAALPQGVEGGHLVSDDVLAARIPVEALAVVERIIHGKKCSKLAPLPRPRSPGTDLPGQRD